MSPLRLEIQSFFLVATTFRRWTALAVWQRPSEAELVEAISIARSSRHEGLRRRLEPLRHSIDHWLDDDWPDGQGHQQYQQQEEG